MTAGSSWASAGATATIATASIAASIINFFNFYLLVGENGFYRRRTPTRGARLAAILMLRPSPYPAAAAWLTCWSHVVEFSAPR